MTTQSIWIAGDWSPSSAASMLGFAAPHCYDNVLEARLPPALKDHAPNDSIWRSVDGAWIQGDVP